MASSDGFPSALFFLSSRELVVSLDDYEDDVSGWLNDLLDDTFDRELRDEPVPTHFDDNTRPLDLSDLDKRVGYLSARLELASQDTSSQLEQAIEDITRTVPRLTYDLQFMRESALSLQVALQTIQHKTHPQSNVAEGSQGDTTTEALERLHLLSSVKSRMESAREVLREAESWSTLEPEVTSLLASQSYLKASERLAEASKSMMVFQNTPEFEARRSLMTSLQNQLEASLSSALVASVNSKDVNTCRNYYSIFSHIQRETEFRNYYNGSRRAAIVSSWQNVILTDCEGEPASMPSTPEPSEIPASPTKFAEYLGRFFAEFLSLVNEERTFTPAIFPDPQQTLSTFIQSTIDSLVPSLSQRLSGLAQHYGALALPELIKAFQTAEEFAVATEKVMEKVGYSALLSPATPFEDGSPNKAHTRRPSKRMSISRRMGSNRALSVSGINHLVPGGLMWEQALFEPFIDLQAEYSTLEKKYLDKALRGVVGVKKSAKSSKAKDTSDGARILRERSVAVFSVAEESLGHCMKFTHGYGAVGLVRSIDSIFESLLEDSKVNFLAPKSGNARTPSDDDESGEAFEELDYSSEDWAGFQLALHLLETCRVIRERLVIFEGKVRSSLFQVSSALKLARVDPNGLYLTGTTKGEAQLLAQSTLNSVELRTLLDTLDDSMGATPTRPETRRFNFTQARILSGAYSSATAFTRASQLFLQKTILSPLHKHLGSYGALPVWSNVPDQRKKSTFDAQTPSFSLSPSHTMQRVAEGLLNLPRLFEVYADDDALAFSIETLPFVDTESLRKYLDPIPPPSLDDSFGSPPSALRRLSSASSHISLSMSFINPVTTTPAAQPLTAEMVSSTWLSSLTLSLLSHLTTAVLPSIDTLTTTGAAQLASDLGYLSNIVQALNVEWEDLERWKEFTEMGDEGGRNKAVEAKNGGLLAGEDVFKIVSAMRRWNISTP